MLVLRGKQVERTSAVRNHAGRRLGDADRGKPSAELVGIGHGVWRMWVGKGMAMALSGGGPATP